MATLQELGRTVFLHLPYSPDLALADYHFLQSMVNEISNRILENKKSL